MKCMATALEDDHLAAQGLEADGTVLFEAWLRNPAVAQHLIARLDRHVLKLVHVQEQPDGNRIL